APSRPPYRRVQAPEIHSLARSFRGGRMRKTLRTAIVTGIAIVATGTLALVTVTPGRQQAAAPPRSDENPAMQEPDAYQTRVEEAFQPLVQALPFFFQSYSDWLDGRKPTAAMSDELPRYVNR